MVWFLSITVFLLLAGFIWLSIECARVVSSVFLRLHIEDKENYEEIEDVERVEFLTNDEVKLKGIFFKGRSEEERKPTIIFCHEKGSNKYSFARYCLFLAESGFNIFSFDFRGHGESSNSDGYIPKEWVTDKEVLDLLAAVEYVRQRDDVDEERTGYFGISRGACISVCAARLNGIKFLICDSIFSTKKTMDSYICKWAPIYIPMDKIVKGLHQYIYSYLRFLCLRKSQFKYNCRYLAVEKMLESESNIPILFIHGKKDNYISYTQTEELFRMTKSEKDILLVENARHNESVLVEPEQYKEKIRSFLERCI